MSLNNLYLLGDAHCRAIFSALAAKLIVCPLKQVHNHYLSFSLVLVLVTWAHVDGKVKNSLNFSRTFHPDGLLKTWNNIKFSLKVGFEPGSSIPRQKY